MDSRTPSQRWADAVTAFSGSWPFIGMFTGVCALWILTNVSGLVAFDPYPFLFLNWVLTVVSTLQNPLIMLSQNRQNENDREKTAEILKRLEALQAQVQSIKEGA